MPEATIPATRELRGLALYRERGDEIEPLGHGRYSVPGCSGGNYTVDLAVFGGEESCSCPDHRRHPEHSCKHLIAATIYRARAGAARRAGGRRPTLSPESVAANVARMA